jgi:hypothetical protein
LLVLFVGLVPGSASAQEPGQTVIDANYGSLTVMGIFQALAIGRIDGSRDLDRNGDGASDDLDDAYPNNHFDFMLQRARIILKGHLLSPNLTYVFQGDATTNPWALDARIGYAIPEGEGYSTTISAGRFLPPFTLILPRLVSRLGMINYPLYLFGTWGAGDPRQPFAWGGATGRQAGLLVTQKIAGMLTIDVGVFNGMQRAIEAGGWGDDNDAKDFFFRVAAVPTAGLNIALDFWAGFPNSVWTPPADPATPWIKPTATAFAMSADDPALQNDTNFFGVFEVEANMVENLNLMGEFVVTHQITRSQTVDPADPALRIGSENATTGLGFWVHGGYTFKGLLGAGSDLEAAVRLDYFDRNIDVADTSQMRVTIGPHFFFEGIHSQIRLNYVLDMIDFPAAADPMFADVRHELWLQAVVEL